MKRAWDAEGDYGFVVLAMLLLGGLIYVWGEGAFWPCEPAGRFINGGTCTHLITGDIGGAARLPNGNLLVALGADEGDATNSMRLVEIAATGGPVIKETVLRANDVETHPIRMAVSPDGAQVAVVQSFQGRRARWQTAVFDREGGVLADDLAGLPGYIAFDARGRFLMHPGGVLGEFLNFGITEAYDLAVSQVPQLVNRDETGPLFQEGLTLAYSPDGTLFVQVLDHIESTSTVGLRLGLVGYEDRPGLLLGAGITIGCNYSFSDVAFSPNSKRIAAQFDCPDDWGRVSNTLEVWDYGESKHLMSLPVVNGFSDPFWYDDETIIVMRNNYVRGGTDLFRIDMPKDRRR